MERVSLLLSGGIDSMVVLQLLRGAGRDVEATFVNYGQAALKCERTASASIANHFAISLTELEFHFPARFGSGEIRHRNGLLVFAAAMASGHSAETVAIGVHSGTPYADCSLAFVESLERTLKLSHDRPTYLLAPLKTWKKAEIIAYAKRENLPLHLTYSCESGTMPPCGMCVSCRDRANL